MKIHEEKGKGIYIQGVTENFCGADQEVYHILKVGNSNRAVASTNMNAESSRSHSLFILTI